MAIALPVWILLLALLPLSGLGPLPCLTLATVLTAGLVVLVERRRSRRMREAEAPAGAAPQRARRGPMPASTAVLLTLGGVALLVYVVFVIRAA